MIGEFRVPLLTEKKIATYVWMGEIGEEWNQTYFSQLPSRKKRWSSDRPPPTNLGELGKGESLFLRTLSFLPKPIVMECLDCSFCISQTGGEGFLVPEGGRGRRRVFFSDRAYGGCQQGYSTGFDNSQTQFFNHTHFPYIFSKFGK